MHMHGAGLQMNMHIQTHEHLTYSGH